MKALYIDTTTSYLYTGIVVDGVLLSEIKENCGKDLSSVALQKISEMIKLNNLIANDIDKIIVVNGPGSYTGIRVGVTIAKTFAYSLRKSITTITSLEAMAVSSKSERKFKVPLIDARRGYVFTAIYDDLNNIILKPQYISLDALKTATDNLIDSFQYISNSSFNDIDTEHYNPDIEKVVNTYINKEEINPHAVNPVYLKLTEAEENKKLEII